METMETMAVEEGRVRVLLATARRRCPEVFGLLSHLSLEKEVRVEYGVWRLACERSMGVDDSEKNTRRETSRMEPRRDCYAAMAESTVCPRAVLGAHSYIPSKCLREV